MSDAQVATIPVSVIKGIRWQHNEIFLHALVEFGETYATRHLETELDVIGAVEMVLSSVCDGYVPEDPASPQSRS